MADGLEFGLPSSRYIQTLIREKTAVEIDLLTNTTVSGCILWQDEHCLCIGDPDRSTLVWKQAIAVMKPS